MVKGTGKISFISMSVLLGLSVGALGQTAKADSVPVQMLGINDFHGALSTTGSYYDGAGHKTPNAGTASLMAGYFDQSTKVFMTKNTNGISMRVQAGDMVGASPANSGLLQDQPTMRVLNQMKFDVGTLGNHEFDEGLAEYNRILNGDKPAKDSNFYPIVYDYNNDYTKDQLKGGFDLVIANVKDKMTGKNPYDWKDYTVKEYDQNGQKVKIGFIGVVTTEIPNLVLAAHHKDYNFTDPAQAIADNAKTLVEKEKVNAIVVLGHTPSMQNGADGATGETAEIINKVNQLYPANSVDAYFAGHNHVYTDAVVGKTRVVQSTSQGKGYIDLQGTYDTEKGDFAATPEATVNPVRPTDANYTAPAANQDVQAIVDDASERVKAVTEQKIGTAEQAKDITRNVNDVGESPAGNLITDAQLHMAEKKGVKADFAMTNNGGIRADLKVGSDGSITWGAAQAVQPFGNILQVVEMTGAQIKNVLNEQTFSHDPVENRGNGYFLQVAGLKYSVIDNPDQADKDHPLVVDTLTKTNGEAIEAGQTYRVVINDFLFGGGDGFAEFTKAKLVGALDPDTETFIGYIQDLAESGKKVVAAIDGRKTYTKEPAVTKQPVYRLYNPNSSEHFYTLHAGEKDNLIKLGWNDEGISWQAPDKGDAVYRLYNPNAGDHHYTMSVVERDTLKNLGWKDEGRSFYSGGDKDIYRLYNKNAVAGAHHYTRYVSERDSLKKIGWTDEGVGFKGFE